MIRSSFKDELDNSLDSPELPKYIDVRHIKQKYNIDKLKNKNICQTPINTNNSNINYDLYNVKFSDLNIININNDEDFYSNNDNTTNIVSICQEYTKPKILKNIDLSFSDFNKI